MSGSKKVTYFRSFSVARQLGEVARFRLIRGAEAGNVYVIFSTQFTLGRGEEADIKLGDLRASRIHAFCARDANAEWTIKDQSSANGFCVNGEKVIQSVLTSGDVLQIGETFLEFLTADVNDLVLVHGLGGISKNLRKKTIEPPVPQQAPKQTAPSQGPRVVIYLLLAGLLGVLFFPDSSKKKVKSSSSPKNELNNLASFLPDASDNSKLISSFFKNGFREYLSGNFNRAKIQFETILQISPNNFLAKLYLENCMQDLNREVSLRMKYGKQSVDAGKLKEAKGHYERILRLLYKDTNNENYNPAKQALEQVNKEIQKNNLIDSF